MVHINIINNVFLDIIISIVNVMTEVAEDKS